MSDLEINSNGIKIPGEVITTAYNDAIHPGLSEAGKTIALPFRAINWIAEVAGDYCVAKMKNTQKLQESVQEKIADIPEEQLCEPAKNIAVPAILSNSYTDDDELRSMYANLLANSMNQQKAYHAHPSFVEIIKQLTPNEALLLKSSNLLKRNVPTCQIRYQEKSSYSNVNGYNLSPSNIVRDFQTGIPIVKYYIPSIENISIDEIQVMIDNFIRLSLVENPSGKILIDKEIYQVFYKDNFSANLEVTYSQSNNSLSNYEIAHILGYITPTTFGERFYKICVE